jgi:hypothetical protein
MIFFFSFFSKHVQYAEIGLPDRSALTDDLHRAPIFSVHSQDDNHSNKKKSKLVSRPSLSLPPKLSTKQKRRSQQGAK